MDGKGKGRWKSSDRFGGTNNFYDTNRKSDLAFRPGSGPDWRVFIPGRILVKDLYRDGVLQIIVNKNEFSSGRISERIRSYEKGEIQGLVWDEESLMPDWKTREIKGYIADYQIKDVDNDGNEELVVAVVSPRDIDEAITGFLTRKTRSNIYFFKLY